VGQPGLDKPAPGWNRSGYERTQWEHPVARSTWSEFNLITISGDPINAVSTFIQYRAVFTTNDANQTPALNDVAISHAPPADLAPTAVDDSYSTNRIPS